MSIEIKKTESFPVSIYIAGDITVAKQICREYCMEIGACVTVTEADYIYTGGAESGVVVGLVNHPRFPSTEQAIFDSARTLGEILMEGLCQTSFLLQSPNTTEWHSRRGEN